MEIFLIHLVLMIKKSYLDKKAWVPLVRSSSRALFFT